MNRKLAVVALGCVACAGDSKPRGAFERMADAAQAGSAPDLFQTLDDESRNAVSVYTARSAASF